MNRERDEFRGGNRTRERGSQAGVSSTAGGSNSGSEVIALVHSGCCVNI